MMIYSGGPLLWHVLTNYLKLKSIAVWQKQVLHVYGTVLPEKVGDTSSYADPERIWREVCSVMATYQNPNENAGDGKMACINFRLW